MICESASFTRFTIRCHEPGDDFAQVLTGKNKRVSKRNELRFTGYFSAKNLAWDHLDN